MNFGNAGVTEESVGKNGRFKHRILHPWRCIINTETHLLPMLQKIFGKFTLIDSLSMGGVHKATIIDDKDGTRFEIEIYPTHINVYPATNEHQAASERLFKIFEMYCGSLDTTQIVMRGKEGQK